MSELHENSCFIAEAIKEKWVAILTSSNVMSLLTEGFQAWKTGSEKEIVLIWIERAGKEINVFDGKNSWKGKFLSGKRLD